MSIKISQLPSASAVTADDLLPIVDDIGGTPITRKATAQQVLKFITGSVFDTLSVTQLTSSDSQIDNLASTNINATDIQADSISTNTISASTYIGLPSLASGPEKSVQFNSSSQSSGSANLIFDYTTSILSGVAAQFTSLTGSISGSTAQFNIITGSQISGSTAQFNIVSGNFGHFSGNIIVYGTAALDPDIEAAYVVYEESIDKIIIFPGLYVSGNVQTTGNLSAGTISASSYVGLPSLASGPENSVQFNVSSQSTGSSNLIFNNSTNTLSGVTAQFTTLTASNITGSTAQFTTLSASNGEFIGDVIIYGTASLDANPEAAYIIYSSSLDKIVIFPGLSVIGDIDANNFNIFNISASSIDVQDITTNTISASSYIGLPEITLEKTLVSASVALSASQRAVFATNNNTSSLTITMPSVGTADSREYHIIKADSLTGSVFISGSSPDLINGQTSFELNGPYQSITLISDGTNWFVF